MYSANRMRIILGYCYLVCGFKAQIEVGAAFIAMVLVPNVVDICDLGPNVSKDQFTWAFAMQNFDLIVQIEQ